MLYNNNYYYYSILYTMGGYPSISDNIRLDYLSWVWWSSSEKTMTKLSQTEYLKGMKIINKWNKTK